jgi:hypothetical protein
MSGASNVRHWLVVHSYPLDAAVVERIYAAAKQADRTLTDGELHGLASGDMPT